MRNLMTVRVVDGVSPIEGADAIEIAHVGGWQCVVKKGEFKPGDHGVYIEIDSFLPDGKPAWQFLVDKHSRTMMINGEKVSGHRLRTIKLRGQISQGLLLPLSVFALYVKDNAVIVAGDRKHIEIARVHGTGEDTDIAKYYGVVQYEQPIPVSLAGQVRGNYPAWLPKTDLERVENLSRIQPGVYVVQEKLEGSSMTVFIEDGEVGVTSRNMNLKLDQEGNTFVDVAKASGLLEWLRAKWEEAPDEWNYVALRGELIGPGIQGNIYGLSDFEFRLFDVYVSGLGYVDASTRIPPGLVKCVPGMLPVIKRVVLSEDSRDQCIASAGGSTALESATRECLREGLVYKLETDQNVRFKAISRAYLAGES